MDQNIRYNRLSTSPLYSSVETFVAQSVLLNGLIAPVMSFYNSAVTKRVTFGEAMLAHFKSPVSWGISGALAAMAALKTYRQVKDDHALYEGAIQSGEVQRIALERQGTHVVKAEQAEIGAPIEGKSHVEKLDQQASQETAKGR